MENETISCITNNAPWITFSSFCVGFILYFVIKVLQNQLARWENNGENIWKNIRENIKDDTLLIFLTIIFIGGGVWWLLLSNDKCPIQRMTVITLMGISFTFFKLGQKQNNITMEETCLTRILCVTKIFGIIVFIGGLFLLLMIENFLLWSAAVISILAVVIILFLANWSEKRRHNKNNIG